MSIGEASRAIRHFSPGGGGAQSSGQKGRLGADAGGIGGTGNGVGEAIQGAVVLDAAEGLVAVTEIHCLLWSFRE